MSLVVSGQNVKFRRKRIGPMRISSDHCRNCKDRKIKCDGERPSCRRCRLSGRACKGYAIWEVLLNAPEQFAACSHVIASIDECAANRTQLISNFIWQQYPSFRLAAPAAAHSSNTSFLHSLAESEVFSPMLQTAVETLCLTYLANAGVISSVLQQESYGRTLSLLRAALDEGRLKVSPHGRKDIVATSAALSLLPAPREQLGQGVDRYDVQAGLHLVGASTYLHEHGPSSLGGGTAINTGLLFNIHVHSLCIAFAQRKRVRWTRPEWRAVEDFRVEPPPQFPAIAQYHPGCTIETGFVWCVFPPREFMIDHLHDLPGLLERADAFVEGAMNERSRKLFECELDDLVQRLDSLQKHSTEPISDSDLVRKPAIVNVEDFDLFDALVEEHAFMQIDRIFDEFYHFANSNHGGSCTFIHLMCLLSDCALLQVMYSAVVEKGISPVSTYIDLLKVEGRAYWHASEICRCALFYTTRTLSGARWLYGLLRCTQNFFESYGAVREMQWCQGCAMATRARIERVEPSYTPMLCRVVDMMESLPNGCRYSRVWQAKIRT